MLPPAAFPLRKEKSAPGKLSKLREELETYSKAGAVTEALAVSSDNYGGDPSRREGVWFLCAFILSVTQAR